MRFPLYAVNGNDLVNLSGVMSSFFYYDGIDTDQDLNTYNKLNQELVNSKINLFKAYQINGAKAINVFGETSIGELLNTSNINPLSKVSFDQVEIYEDYLTHKGKYYRVLEVTSYPGEIETKYLVNKNYVLIAHKVVKSESKSILDRKRRLHFGNLFKPIKDIESTNSYHEIEQCLEEINSNTEALFKTKIYFISLGETKKDLDVDTDELKDHLNELGFINRVVGRDINHILGVIFPGTDAIPPRSILAPSSFTAALVPVHRGHIFKEGVRFTSVYGNDLFINLFDKSCINFNALITGMSGQGKSMLGNYLVKSLSFNSQGIVLDKGHSFEMTAMYVNEGSKSLRINPLNFKDPSYLVEFISSFTDYKWSLLDKGKLLKIIKSKKLDSISFLELIDFLEDEFSGIGFYFEPYFEYLIDETLEIGSFIYCDLDNYPKRFQAPLIIYLLECFKHQKGQRFFLFDECWDILVNNAEYISECFRTFRKFNASAICISQNLEDFSQSPLGRSIIQNCYHQFYFKQEMMQTYNLEERDLEYISNLVSIKGRYSEFYYKNDSAYKVCRYYGSPLEFELFNTEPEHRLALKEYISDHNKYFPLKKIIHNYVDFKYYERRK